MSTMRKLLWKWVMKILRLIVDECLDISEQQQVRLHRCTAGVAGVHQTGGAVDLTLFDSDGILLVKESENPAKVLPIIYQTGC